MRAILRVLVLLGSGLFSSLAMADAPTKPIQFLGILRLVPRLHDDRAWTKDDQAAVGRHFTRLKAATESGQVILAGRTAESGDRTMGLVIFEAADAQAAETFMAEDPAVVSGVMLFEVRPYNIALLRK
jgi:uncharacterized protein YciI